LRIDRVACRRFGSVTDEPRIVAEAAGTRVARLGLMVSRRRPPLQSARTTRELRVEAFMTPNPQAIRPDETLARAWELMLTHDVHHLPVVDDGRVVGILSDRDITLAKTFDLDAKAHRAEQIMTREVYTAEPTANLGRVVKEMAERRIGSAVIVDGDRIAGLFTTLDALHALAEMVRG
jgi:acetoin utilization protein AcuB